MRGKGASRKRPEVAVGLALTVLVALGYLFARDVPAIAALEGATLDWRFHIRGSAAPGPETAIVDLDDRTLAALGRWPVSRMVLAHAIDALARDGAAVIALDLLVVGPEDDANADAALARAIAAAGNVVVPFAFVFRPTPGVAPGLPDGVARGAYAVTRAAAGERTGPAVYPDGVLAPAPAILEAGTPAHVSVVVDADGVLRHLHPVIGYAGAYFPALPVVAAWRYLGLDPADVVVRFGEGLSLGPRMVPTTPDMRLPIDYRGPAGSFESHSLIDVVEGRVPEGTFRGRIVLIGATAQGLGDRFNVPVGGTMPGVEVFANAVDNLVHGPVLDQSAAVSLWDLLAIVVAALLIMPLARAPGLVPALAAGLALIAAWGAIAAVAFAAAQVWLSVVFPAAALAAGTLAITVGQSLRERRQRQRAEHESGRLSRYISPLASEHLATAKKDGTAPDADTHQAAVMFVDMRGFTAASEHLSPGETMALLRAFHQRVERAVDARGGKIDKFIGDGALAVFGTAQPDPSDARRALACARDLAAETARWDESRRAEGQPSVRIGIGVHAGLITLGEAGGEAHRHLTVAGDTVNVASRLEAMTRERGVTIIASDAVVEAARAASAGPELEGFVELPMLEIRGRRRPLGAWAWPAPGEED